jgi:hypothetical protein
LVKLERHPQQHRIAGVEPRAGIAVAVQRAQHHEGGDHGRAGDREPAPAGGVLPEHQLPGGVAQGHHPDPGDQRVEQKHRHDL